MKLLHNSDIELRAIEPEDLDLLFRCENDTSLWIHAGTQAPFSRFQLREYIESSTSNLYTDLQLRLMIVSHQLGGATVGMVDLTDFEPLHARAAVGIVVDRPYQGRGIATQALALLSTYAQSHLKLHQLYAHITPHNEASRRLFAAAGFEHTATLKSWQYMEGGYSDLTVYQKLLI